MRRKSGWLAETDVVPNIRSRQTDTAHYTISLESFEHLNMSVVQKRFNLIYQSNSTQCTHTNIFTSFLLLLHGKDFFSVYIPYVGKITGRFVVRTWYIFPWKLLYYLFPLQARSKIFEVYLKSMPTKNIDIPSLAEKTDGLTGADIENLCREVRGYFFYSTYSAFPKDMSQQSAQCWIPHAHR